MNGKKVRSTGNMLNNFYLTYLDICLKNYIFSFLFKKNSLILNIDANFLNKFLIFLKKNSVTKFKLLMDILAIDLPHRRHRFSIIYKLDSLCFNFTIFLSTNILQNQGISSALDIFSSAGWLEREVWDFFGIFFINHNDLRRILTDYGFSGFPFRKDFPLSGYFEVYYMDEKKRVVLEPLDISQEFRFFDFNSPWEIKK